MLAILFADLRRMPPGGKVQANHAPARFLGLAENDYI